MLLGRSFGCVSVRFEIFCVFVVVVGACGWVGGAKVKNWLGNLGERLWSWFVVRGTVQGPSPAGTRGLPYIEVYIYLKFGGVTIRTDQFLFHRRAKGQYGGSNSGVRRCSCSSRMIFLRGTLYKKFRGCWEWPRSKENLILGYSVKFRGPEIFFAPRSDIFMFLGLVLKGLKGWPVVGARGPRVGLGRWRWVREKSKKYENK